MQQQWACSTGHQDGCTDGAFLEAVVVPRDREVTKKGGGGGSRSLEPDKTRGWGWQRRGAGQERRVGL